MNEHPIEGLMKTTMESIKEMVDVNTIVGDAVETPDGTVIIPISKVSFGFASGGGEYSNEIKKEKRNGNQDEANASKDQNSKFPFAGGTGAGVSVQPVAFMVVGNGEMKLMSVDQKANMIDNLVSTTPKVLNTINTMFNKKSKQKEGQNDMISYE